MHAGRDVHGRRDKVLNLKGLVTARLEEDGEVDHLFHAGAWVARDEVGDEVLLLSGAL